MEDATIGRRRRLRLLARPRQLQYINDRFGRQAGDTIFRDFAVRIQSKVRRSDCFGRVGGEEFLLVLPNTSTAAAELIVERMLAAIRNFKTPALKAWGLRVAKRRGLQKATVATARRLRSSFIACDRGEKPVSSGMSQPDARQTFLELRAA